tara:strand:- start:1354 stop:1716 length:363 start_codon:yes stop_codon:yes gene_type:complete
MYTRILLLFVIILIFLNTRVNNIELFKNKKKITPISTPNSTPVDSRLVVNNPINIFKKYQDSLDIQIENYITDFDIINYKKCGKQPINNNPNLILGYDPTQSYIFYRKDNFTIQSRNEST